MNTQDQNLEQGIKTEYSAMSKDQLKEEVSTWKLHPDILGDSVLYHRSQERRTRHQVAQSELNQRSSKGHIYTGLAVILALAATASAAICYTGKLKTPNKQEKELSDELTQIRKEKAEYKSTPKQPKDAKQEKKPIYKGLTKFDHLIRLRIRRAGLR